MRLNFCVACGDDNPEHLDHHHLVARANGGTDDETNLITLCRSCHGKMHGAEWSNNHTTLIKAGMIRAKKSGKSIGRPRIAPAIRDAIRLAYENGNLGMRAVGEQFGVSSETVRRCLLTPR